MTVCQCSCFCANHVRPFIAYRRIAIVQSDRCRTHDTTAALAVVYGIIHRTFCTGFDCIHAGHARCASAEQLRNLQQTRIRSAVRQGEGFRLRAVPVLICFPDGVNDICVLYECTKHPFRSEQRHLRIIRYLGDIIVQYQIVFGDAIFAILRENLVLSFEFHCISQSISGCPSYETATEFVDIAHLSLLIESCNQSLINHP